MSLYSRAEKVMRPALCSETAMDFLQEADAALAIKDAEIARLRDRLDSALSQSSLFGDALHAIANRCEGMASRIARAALAPESRR